VFDVVAIILEGSEERLLDTLLSQGVRLFSELAEWHHSRDFGPFVKPDVRLCPSSTCFGYVSL
jgi:hypothetical protein